MASITLISKPGCTQCTIMKAAFEGEGIEHTVVDMAEDVEVIDSMIADGTIKEPIMGAPVTIIETEGETIQLSGFQPPGKIKSILAEADE